MPATLSTITGTFAAEHRAKAVSIWAGVAGAGAVVGVLASGLLLEAWSWRSIFALNVVLVIAAIVGTLRFVPESADPAAPRLDVPGALLAGLGLIVLVYSIIEAPTHGWVSTRTADADSGQCLRGGPCRARLPGDGAARGGVTCPPYCTPTLRDSSACARAPPAHSLKEVS
jgi:MFS family permease